ncbi:hypothetical protein [Galbibacter sp. BG1]
MNIYIKAMQIGSDNLDNGITYPDMIKNLEKFHSIKLNTHSEFNFFIWFLDNFTSINSINYYNKINNEVRNNFSFFLNKMNREIIKDDEYDYVSERLATRKPFKEDYPRQNKHYHTSTFIKNFFNQKFFLSGNTNKQYVDYLELSEARQSSKEALKKAEESIKLTKDSILYAKGALIIAIVTSVISICITLFKEEPKYPQPPYDVKLNEPINVKVNNPVQTYPLPKLDTTKTK